MTSGRWGSILINSVVAGYCVLWVSAQQSAFQWGFNDWTSTTLPQCQPLDIFVDEAIGTVKPVPPYYLTVFEENGLSTTTYVGNKVGSLTWTVNHLVGSLLVMTMFDSIGNSGGVLTETYTVAGSKTGANASCISSPSSPILTVTSNATSKINTCDVVRLSISGGQKPYMVSIAETNSEAPFNISMGAKDDIYSWVNNLTPGNQVILSAFDANGNYGQSTTLMTLTGTTNTHCSITSSSSTNATNGSNNDNNSGGSGQGKGDNSNGDSKRSSKTGIIAGVAIAAFFAVFFGLIAWFFIRRRKQGRGGPRESRRRWTIDRSDSLKRGVGRARLPSDPTESDITPFAVPPASQASPPISVHGYSDIQATPFSPEALYHGGSTRRQSETTANPRSTNYQDHERLEAEEENAYAMDAFRMSGVGSNTGSQGATGSQSQATQPMRGFRLINEESDSRHKREQKATLAQRTNAQETRAVFQHEDAGIEGLDEIPPAYPGPGRITR